MNSKNEIFNIYYINYTKAYEISMLIDNKILNSSTKEKKGQANASLKAEIDTKPLSKIPFIQKLIPNLNLEGEISGERYQKVIDMFKVVSTKSTILDSIYKLAKNTTSLSKCKNGELIRIDNISLEITNPNDVIGTKALLSGILNQIPVEGFGSMNFTALMEVFLKDSAYILSGKISNDISQDNNILMKIPMQAENEMESQYSISDVEIGEMTVVGIYKGSFIKKKIEMKINRMMSLKKTSSTEKTNTNKKKSDIEEGQPVINENKKNDTIYYIDVIAIVQPITFSRKNI
jgi:hypothetical protein